MDGPECARRLRRVDHDRDVALRRALCDGADVDAGCPERVEQLRRDARCARHAVADHGENAAVAGHVDALDLPLAQLTVEDLSHDRGRAISLRLLEGEADGVLRASLRDQGDRDAVLAQRAEQALRRTGYADHAGAFDVDQGDLVDARNPLDRMRRHRLLAD